MSLKPSNAFICLVLIAIVISVITIAVFFNFTSTVVNQPNQAIDKQRQEAVIGSSTWLVLSKQLAKNNSEIALELVNFYLTHSNGKDKHELTRLDKNNAKIWLNEARLQGADFAILTLAKQYYRDHKNLLALMIADFILDTNPEKVVLQKSIAIDNGEVLFADNELENLKTSREGNNFLTLLSKYRISPLNTAKPTLVLEEVSENNCPVSIALIATRIIDIPQLESISTQLAVHPLGEFICISDIKFNPIGHLNCTTEPLVAIQCDEQYFINESKNINSKYLAVMLPQGKANVHYGILYFDQHDTINIIAHEITHLFGFVDEYPLSESHRTCQKNQLAPFAQNIAVLPDVFLNNPDYKNNRADNEKLRQQVLSQLPWASFIDESTPILRWDNNRWHLGTPNTHQDKVGLFLAETCDKSNTTAFKPLYKLTSLRSSDKEFPLFYLTLLTESANKFLMPSFHYNIALALYKNGEIDQAKQWLKIAASWEINPERHNKVLKGQL